VGWGGVGALQAAIFRSEIIVGVAAALRRARARSLGTIRHVKANSFIIIIDSHVWRGQLQVHRLQTPTYQVV